MDELKDSVNKTQKICSMAIITTDWHNQKCHWKNKQRKVLQVQIDDNNNSNNNNNNIHINTKKEFHAASDEDADCSQSFL